MDDPTIRATYRQVFPGWLAGWADLVHTGHFSWWISWANLGNNRPSHHSLTFYSSLRTPEACDRARHQPELVGPGIFERRSQTSGTNETGICKSAILREVSRTGNDRPSQSMYYVLARPCASGRVVDISFTTHPFWGVDAGSTPVHARYEVDVLA